MLLIINENMSKIIIIISFIININWIQLICAQVAYPTPIELSSDRKNLQGRLPLYTPTRCGKYELLYPGDQRNDWICDCEPGAIYHADSDECFPAYRRGPCALEEYLVLRNNSVMPICLPNDCKIDGQVKVQNVCYKLGEVGPCKNDDVDLYIVHVNPHTLMVDCVKLNIEEKIEEEPQRKSLCKNPGSKRFVQGHCATTLKPA